MKIEIIISEGTPFILLDGEPAEYAEGIKAIIKEKDWTRKDIAHYLNVSIRTVDGWMTGRKPSNSTLTALKYILNMN